MPAPTEVLSRSSSSHSTLSHAHPLHHIATQDLERGSPTPKFEVEKPRRRSVSPVPSNSVPNPALASSSKATAYTPPPLTWRTAAQDAMAGIYYTKDAFPSSGSSLLPPPFSREPVAVESGERVELLEEVDEYAVRVRVLRTGTVGLIPGWNTEGALERLTRMNTAFNEAATCPVEARAFRRRDSTSSGASSDGADSPTDASLSHAHSRCIPFATRVRFPHYYGISSAFSDCEDDSDSDVPQSPPEYYERGRPLHARAAVFEAQPQTLEKGGISEAAERSGSGSRKSVNFASGERPQVVFRYPSEDLVGAFLGEGAFDGSDSEEQENDEWWWQGWEETCEELAVDGQMVMNFNLEMSDIEEIPGEFGELFPFAFDEADL